MVNRRSGFLSLLAFYSIFIVGCYSGLQVKSSDESLNTSEDVEVEAYLFDVKVRRKGKPTSLRLDLYQTDSVVAMYGRGYFNKGAFSGRLTADSMQIYFPSTGEYLYESIENLFLSFDCESDLIGLNLLVYFLDLPIPDSLSENLVVKTIKDEEKEKEFNVSSRNCPWVLALSYSYEDSGWRIDAFDFDDHKEVTIKGNRRIYKNSAAVSGERFRVNIPADAIKITL